MTRPPTHPDIDLMKRVNRQFVTGVTVVTAMDGGDLLGDLLGDWLGGTLDIDSIIGQVPILGDLAKQIGLIPDDLGNLLDPINYVIDEAGNVVGTLTCGRFKNIGGSLLEQVCYVIGVQNQSARMLIPDGLMSLDPRLSRFRHPVQTLGDDGWLEIEVAEAGAPGFATQVFRRYANDGTGARGVGMELKDSMVSLVRRVGGNDAIVKPALGSFGPGSRIRLAQVGDTHTLFRDGIQLGEPWEDLGATAAKGALNRSVAMVMAGAKEFQGGRRFSPSLASLEAG
jgi:hypothetical protein